MNTGDFFPPAVGLAFYVDDRDDRAFFAVFISGDDLTDSSSQRVGLFKADFAVARTRESPVCVRNYTKETGLVITD
jgi:hypothetical protein